jgi:CMP-N-acetylneuraminic acid synthetase
MVGLKKLCYIQARGGSKRFPRKNLMPWHGVPMVADSIIKAQESELFDTIAVSSDSPEILDIAVKYGVLPLWRSPEASSDKATDDDVAREVMRYFPTCGIACKLYPCVPLLTVDNIRDVYYALYYGQNSAIMTVDDNGKDAGAVYFFNVADYRANGRLSTLTWGKFILPICQDINTPEDYYEAVRKDRND